MFLLGPSHSALLTLIIWQHHRAFQKDLRKFVDETLFPDAQALQENGKKPSQHIFDEFTRRNIHAMRLGPGEHLKGRVLMNGTVKPEEVREMFDGYNIYMLTVLLVRFLPRIDYEPGNVSYSCSWLP